MHTLGSRSTRQQQQRRSKAAPGKARETNATATAEPSSSRALPLPDHVADAARDGEAEVVSKWLDGGGDIDATAMMPVRGPDGERVELHGMTLLMNAACGHEKLVKELLRRKASLEMQNSIGRTALMLCVNHPSIVRLLLRAGARTDVREYVGSRRTALALAKSVGDAECIRLIEEHEATAAKAASKAAPGKARETNATAATAEPSSSGAPPLPVHVSNAARAGDVEAVSKWLDGGGDINATALMEGFDENGERVKVTGTTMLMLAVAKGREKMVKELVRRKASLDMQDSTGHTSMMWAINASKPSIVQILVDAGARTDLCDTTNNAALDVATQMKQSECERILEPISMPSQAISDGDVAAVRGWLERGGNVDITRCKRG